MSFFDDEPEEPTRATRRARPRGGATAARAGGPTDAEAIRRRRLVVAVFAVVVLILLVIGVNSCVDSRHERALRNYNRDVSAIVQSSDDQVSRQLFDVLNGTTSNAANLQSAVQQVRSAADEDVSRAKALHPPGEMKAAQRNLELVLNLRATGVRRIADLIPSALSDQRAQDAISRIAGQMQAFLASDVVYSQRVAPLIRDALDSASISGQTIATSKFLPSIGWLDANQVAERLNPSASTGTTSSDAAATPGTHGHGLVSTVVNGVTLQPGQVVNRVGIQANPSFTITVANQGENDEGPVTVALVVRGGASPIRVTKRINQTRAGTNAEVAIPLGQRPPSATSLTVEVTIRKVPGEKTLDNNTSTYTVVFE